MALSALTSVSIVERDTNEDVMQVWSYPSIEPKEMETVILDRTRLKSTDGVIVPFSFSKFDNYWLYIVVVNNNRDDEEENKLKRVIAYSISLISKEYNPELYANLAKILAGAYMKTGSPLSVLQGFLKVLTTGTLADFNKVDFPEAQSYIATSIKDVIRLFGMEIILLWAALMMKKRVVVFGDKLTTLLRVIRSFPLFIWHRRDFGILRPYVNMTEIELQDLERSRVYCAGFIDPDIKNHQNLYDLFIDIPERSFTVPDHAKADFRLGAFHRDVATFLVEQSEDEEITPLQILMELTNRAKEFIAKLELLQEEDENGNKTITLESLQQRQLPQNMDRFIYAVASAEGLTR